MRNIKLTIAYDGYDYHGWQVQPGVATIQGEVEKALKKLTGQEIEVSGASRTDAGVSALGQVANIKIGSPVPTENFAKAITQLLPNEIVITEAVEVGKNFSARFDAKSKQYQYKIYAGQNKPVLDIRHCWFMPCQLDVEAMQQAAGYLVGEKDFKSFASSGDQRESTVRTIYKCDVESDGDWIDITVEGNGFLYNMVRNMVGTLVDIGRGHWQAEYMREILDAKDRTKAGMLAPAHGLCLMWIEYD